MPVMYVNKAILAQADVPTDSYPQTIEELRSVAEKIKAAERAGSQDPLVIKVDSWFVENWLTGAGKPLVDNDNGRSGLATESELVQPDTTRIYEWLPMIDDGLATAIPSSSTGVDEYLALNAKSSAILIQTSTAISTVAALLEGSVSKDQLWRRHRRHHQHRPDIDVALQPGLEEAGQARIGGSAWYMVKTDEKLGVPAVRQFIRYYLQTPNQVT